MGPFPIFPRRRKSPTRVNQRSMSPLKPTLNRPTHHRPYQSEWEQKSKIKFQRNHKSPTRQLGTRIVQKSRICMVHFLLKLAEKSARSGQGKPDLILFRKRQIRIMEITLRRRLCAGARVAKRQTGAITRSKHRLYVPSRPCMPNQAKKCVPSSEHPIFTSPN